MASYLVSFAGNVGDNHYDVTGKDVVFAATDAVFEPVDLISTYSTDYKFVGTTASASLADAYVLASDGSAFVKADGNLALSPFTACMVANNKPASAAAKLVIAGATPTSITAVEAEALDGQPVYNLSGMKVGTYDAASGLGTLPSGVYIVGGKKIVK